MLGVSRDADAADHQEGLPQARPPAPPRRQPGPGDAGAVQGRLARLRGAQRPRQARGLRPRRRRLQPGLGGRRPGLLLHRHHGRVLRRRCRPAAAARAAARAQRVRRGQDALIRLDVELAEAAFGVTTELKVDTAVACRPATARGTAPGTSPITCETCRGPARSPWCSARSSARSAPCARARPAAASARSSPTPAASAPATAGSARGAPSTSRSPPASTTAPASSSPGRARSAPAAARPATSTSRSTSSRTRPSPATATTCTAPSRCR